MGLRERKENSLKPPCVSTCCGPLSVRQNRNPDMFYRSLLVYGENVICNTARNQVCVDRDQQSIMRFENGFSESLNVLKPQI